MIEAIPVTIWVGIIAAIASVVATALNINSMRKPRESSTAAELTDSATGLIRQMEIRIDKIEANYDELKEEHRLVVKEFRMLWHGGQQNIKQLKELDEVPVFEPSPLQFRGSGTPWAQRTD